MRLSVEFSLTPLCHMYKVLCWKCLTIANVCSESFVLCGNSTRSHLNFLSFSGQDWQWRVEHQAECIALWTREPERQNCGRPPGHHREAWKQDGWIQFRIQRIPQGISDSWGKYQKKKSSLLVNMWQVQEGVVCGTPRIFVHLVFLECVAIMW
jgi:hypothetical protein